MLTKGPNNRVMSATPGHNFFSLGGTLPIDSPSYIERRADQDLLDTLLNREFALVLDSRQKGKSSLLARTAFELHERGLETIKLDLQRFGSSLSADQWYATMLFTCAEQLDDVTEARAFWKERENLGPGERWIQYLERRAKRAKIGLIVFIDEIDFVRSLPFDTDELFALIRSSYNQRSEDKDMAKLTFCFCGASSPAGLVRNPNNGQMIIGRRIQLDDFEFEETVPYAKTLSSDESLGIAVLRKIYSWTHGHPFLTQIACYEWMRNHEARHPRLIDDFFTSQLSTVGNQYRSDHLISMSKAILAPSLPGLDISEGRPLALQTLSKILKGHRNRLADLPREVTDYLCITGVIKEWKGRFVMRNRIYAHAFGQGWIMDNLPDAEVHRLRQSARRAFMTTGLTAVAIITALSVLAARNYRLANNLTTTLEASRVRENQALREAYIGGMQSVAADTEDKNFMRAGVLINELKSSPFRDWEWWFIKRKLSRYTRSTHFERAIVDWLSNPKGQISVLAHQDKVEIFDADGKVKESHPIKPGHTLVASDAETIIISQPGKSVVFSPDGIARKVDAQVIAVRNNRQLLTDSGRKKTLLTDLQGNQIGLGFPQPADSAVLFSDGSHALIRLYRTLKYVDLIKGITLGQIRQDDAVNCHLVNEEKGYVLLATDDTKIIRYNLVTGQKEMEYTGNKGPVRSLAFSPDRQWFASAGADGVVRRYDVETGKILNEFLGHLNRVQSVRVSQDGRSILSAGFDNTIKEWPIDDVYNGVVEVSPTVNAVPRVRTTPNNGFLLLLESGRAELFSTSSTAPKYSWTLGPKDPIVSGEPLKGGLFVAISKTGLGGFFETMTEGNQFHFENLKSPARFVTPVSAVGEVWVAFDNGEVRTVSRQHQLINLRRSASEPITSITMSADGKSVAIGLRDGQMEVWDAETHALAKRLAVTDGSINMLQYSPGGSWISIATATGSVFLLDASLNAAPRVLKGHTSRVWRATFSSDGRFLATCSFDNSARIWNVATGEEIHNLQQKSWVSDAEFNPSGTRLLTTSGDGSARLWDTVSGREVCVLDKGSVPYFSGRFSSDGNWIILCDSGGRTTLWNGSPL